jgi:hypothetical protein
LPPYYHGNRGGNRVYQVNLVSFKIPRRSLDRLEIALRIPDFHGEMFSLFVSQLPESLSQSIHYRSVRSALVDDFHTIDLGLSRIRKIDISCQNQNSEERNNDSHTHEFKIT